MSDLISRQAAIDAIKNIDCSDGVGISSLKCDVVDEAVTAIKALPPAQPEITLESAIDYLHSIGWMQEHDRILSESAQPERPEQPESAREYCAECDHIEMCRWYPYEGCEFRSLPSAQPNTIPMDWIQKYADDWQDMSYAYDNPILGMLEEFEKGVDND